MTSQMTCLRLYFPQRAKIRADTFLRRLFAKPLSSYFLSKAKEAGIDQAVFQPITAGFLKGEPISMDISESPPPRLPQCVELVDQEEKLRQFLDSEKSNLGGVRVLFLRCEDPLIDTTRKSKSS